MLFIIEVYGMLYVPSAGKRASLASIKDLALVYWYHSLSQLDFKFLTMFYICGIFQLTAWFYRVLVLIQQLASQFMTLLDLTGNCKGKLETLFCIYIYIYSPWFFCSYDVNFVGDRPEDSTVLVSLACGSLSGIASSTGE